ncbi:MAG TPA: HDOD domain-containing protein [Tepidisphaeraceae bacterium]|jgi:EAL and modified HD-GYP domain-containing signal transduction protein|nr:HDOD domain-containing protein [Tepidisphaeraceae bacterium]
MTTAIATPAKQTLGVAPVAAAEENSSTVFVGRQPIFDRRKNVFGYELLYRTGDKSNAFAAGTDGDAATRAVLHGSLNVVGLAELTGSKKAFVNCTKTTFVNDEYVVLPPTGSVVELLETVMPDPEILTALKRAKDAGYVLALDDFAFGAEYRPFLPLADILKVDFLATTADQRRRLTEQFSNRGKTLLLAEKVESHEMFEEAVKLGYTYFQGYFFCKPQIISRRDIPAFKQNCLRFIQEVNSPAISFERLEEVVKRDPSLSTKLLRYLNSAAFGLTNRVSSIRQALALLGEKPLRKWASLIAISELGRDKPTELMTTALVRARFCELLASHADLRGRELDCFIMGLLSAVDAFTDQTLAESVADIPLPADVTAALLGGDNPIGQVYSIALAIERGRSVRAGELMAKCGIQFEIGSHVYRQAIEWADQSTIS